MPQDEEYLTGSNRNTNTMTISELPGKPFGIVLEFAIFLIMMGLTLSGTAIRNVLLYRTCVHSLHHDMDECRGFLSPVKTNDTNDLEEEVQKYVTYVSTVITVIESLGPAFLSLFLGVWSDTHGRKPLIVWPLFGISISSMLTVIFSIMGNLGPWWLVVTSIPFSVTGGIRVLITGIYCYLSDVTTTGMRSFRMTMMEIAVSAGSVVGSLISSYVLKAVGNVYLLLIAATLFVIAYAVTNIQLQESLTGAVQGTLSSVFDYLLIKEMITECFKRRPNNLRTQLLLLTFANSLNVFIMYGMSGIEYMYTREKLHWALEDFTQFSAASVLISFLGSFVGVTVIQKYLRVNDLAFSIISFLSSAGEYIVKAFAVLSWHMYLSAGVTVFGSLSSPLIRSYLTKILPVEDIAKVFALMCAIEGIYPLIAPVIFNTLYNVTLTTFPGAVCLLTSAINVSCIVMLLFVAFFRWKTHTTPYQTISVNSNDDNEAE
ncbi:proton-coupled folate transporter-like isoform X2 [Galleria mellonella]|uniref:Proton-coupled folate transporter-like isoform X2 n=2 Tax=Galleria mellonella TaxID=7137 RepID=A0A6J3C094_GALME|nr:proton-coupled folate transporter-like isoform X2 [Galleria mellonella]